MNLSNTHGESKYNRQKRRKRNQNLQSGLSRHNVRAKIVTNPEQIYSPSQNKSLPKPINYLNLVINTIFRITIVGVGIGTIFGTFLANRDLTKPLFPQVNLSFLNQLFTASDNISLDEVVPEKKEAIGTNENLTSETETKGVFFSGEDSNLKNKLVQLKAKYPELEPSAFFVDLDNGTFVNFNGIKSFPAASTIKVPVLVAFLQDVDAGKIYLDEKLKVTDANKVGGSGGMQYQGVGQEYSAIYTATEMIISSDNTATEMIIERLGGKEKLNQRFQQWGLEETTISNLLPDLKGTNRTTARDLAILMAKVNQGELISVRSRDRLMDIMTRTKTRTLLPQGVEPGAMIAHKTGDIGQVLGDVGIIDMPTGKRYVGAVFAMRPHNDPDARTLIQEISRTTYQHFKWYLPRDKK